MDIKVRYIGGEYKELIIKSDNVEIDSSTLDKNECIELARELIQAADELLS